MTVVFEDLDLPDTGTPWPAEVRIRLAGAQGRPVLGRRISTGTTIVGETLLSTTNGGINNAGYWALDLPAQSDISPSGTTWRIERNVPAICQPFVTFISVPITGGPFEASTLEDDPLGEITPSALSGHAADSALHGGGIEVAFASISTGVVVTGSGGLFVQAVPGLLVTVPDLARPVYLIGHVPGLQQAGGPAEGSFGIYPAGNLGIFAALDGVPVPDMDTTTARTVDPMARLAAHSAGDYVIAGSGSGGNSTIRVAASVLNLASLRAIAA